MPGGPGLGLELDRGELERLGKLTKRVIPDFIVRSRFKNGATMLTATKEGARGGWGPTTACRRLRQQQLSRLPFLTTAAAVLQWLDDAAAEQLQDPTPGLRPGPPRTLPCRPPSCVLMNVACGLPQELVTDFWDDDGTEEWRTAWQQTQAAGGCLLTAPARI